MNKKYILASLNNIANKLDEASLYKEASSITNVMKKLAQNDWIFDPRQKFAPLEDNNQVGPARIDLSKYQQTDAPNSKVNQDLNKTDTEPYIKIKVNEFGEINDYTFTGNFTIGRADDNSIVTKIPYISRDHCFIYYNTQYKSWFIKDLDSKSGTYVGKSKITEPLPLGKNYKIKLDDNFMFEVEEIYPEWT